MNYKSAYNQFCQNFIIPQRKESKESLKLLIEENSEKIAHDFESILLKTIHEVYELQQNYRVATWYTCDCSVLISAMLHSKDFLIIEAFGKGWYSEVIGKSTGSCHLFLDYWSQLRTEAKEEAKRYMGKIYEETVDKEMIAWLMLNTRALFPCFENAVKRVVENEKYQACKKDADLKFRFGIYRSVNEICEV